MVDARGRPVPAVDVGIPCGRVTNSEHVRTGPDGRFRLIGVLPLADLAPFSGDPRVVRVDGPAWARVERAVEVVAGEVVDLGDIVVTADVASRAGTAGP